jgi:hypothetical protein
MKAILIHPMDLKRMIESYPAPTELIKSDGIPVDDLIEINGTLFYQTVRVQEIGKK